MRGGDDLVLSGDLDFTGDFEDDLDLGDCQVSVAGEGGANTYVAAEYARKVGYSI